MALQAMWIRKNMLQSPGADYNQLHERQMSENEKRVLRSLQKLSIPEWYLNKSSSPPKILKNDTPIDQRPSSWKNMPVNKTVVCSTPIMPMKSLTVSRNGLLETEIGPLTPGNQSFATYKLNRISPTKKSSSSQKRESPTRSNNTANKRIGKSRLANISRTFPRVSPSRKIQNINIVFPQPPRESKSIMITDLDEPDTPEADMTKDSLNATSSFEIAHQFDETINIQNDSLDGSLTKTKVLPAPNRQLTYIKPWRSATKHSEVKFDVTPIREKLSIPETFKLRASSTPQGSPVSIVTSFDFDTTSEKDNSKPIELFPIYTSDTEIDAKKDKPESANLPNFTYNLDSTGKENRKPPSIISSPMSNRAVPKREKKRPPPVLSRFKKINLYPNDELCDACKMDALRQTPISRGSVGLRPRNSSLLIIEEVRPNSSSKKSSEEIIKNDRPGSCDANKSLVREIIEELNEKCRTSSKPTYVSRGSKNFVKKLVRALENGILPISDQKKENETGNSANAANRGDQDIAEEDAFIGSENGSEDEVKSAAVSTSISYKDTDSSNSSDTDIGSPTLKQDYEKYDWNMNVDKNGSKIPVNNNNDDKKSNNNFKDTKTQTKRSDDDSVYWIPIAKCKLPRTSSVLSMGSKLSINSKGQSLSPCVSPIRQSNDQGQGNFFQPSVNFWGSTYRTNGRNTKKLLRIDETTILDSGYSDRSSARSSRSSCADDNHTMTWFESTETTQTASENGSFFNELSRFSGSTSSNRQQNSPRIYGRSFAI